MSKQKVNIMVGRFQPITTGHIKCIKEIQEKTGNPLILCMINTTLDKLDKKHPFPSTFLLEYYRQHLPVKGIMLVKNADIVAISEALKNYQISGWVCGTDRIDSYKKMAERYHEQANLSDDFEMLEIERTDDDESASKLRKMILEDNYFEFYQMSAITDETYYKGLRRYMLAL